MCDVCGLSSARTGLGRVEKEVVIDSPARIDGRKVYARPGRWGVVVVWPLVSLVPAAFVGGYGTVGAIFGVVLVGVVTVHAVRFARQAVIVDDVGVTVRNAWRTWRCPWAQIRGFEIPGSALLPIALPRMLCVSGRRIRLSGLLVGRRWGQDWVEEQVALLNEEAEQRRPRRSQGTSGDPRP